MRQYNRNMGEYNPETEYQKNDVVTFDGDAYYRTKPGKGVSPKANARFDVWKRLNQDLAEAIFLMHGPAEGLPAGATAHQQLVTDATGVVKWEDREFFKSNLIGFKNNPDADTYEQNYERWTTGTLSVDPETVKTATAIANEVGWGFLEGRYQRFVFYFDGVRCEMPGKKTPIVFEDKLYPFMGHIYQRGADFRFDIVYYDGKEHTFQFELAEPVIKPLSPELIAGTEPESHQMLVTDADGKVKWEERTHYAEIVDTELLPECEVQTESDEVPLFETFVALPVAGEKYVVTWNNVEYECTAEDIQIPVSDTVTATVHCLGNCAAFGEDFGGTATDDPFFIGVIPPETSSLFGGATAIISPLDGSKSVTVKIAGKGERVHQLDKKYLGALRGQIICEIDAATGEASMPFETMWGMDASELQNAIVLKGSEDDVSAAYAVTKITGHAGRCIQFLVSEFEDADSPTETMYHWYGINGNFAAPFGKIYRLPITGASQKGNFVVSRSGVWVSASPGEAKTYLGLSYRFDEGERSGVVLDSTTPDSVKRFFVSVDDTGTLKVEEITE